MASEYIFSKVNFKKTHVKSQVLLYELELKEIFERHPTSPCKERVQEIFRIFAEIIPLLGPSSSLLEVIKDELYRSVYSKDLTSKMTEPFVERVPYFKSVARLEHQKHDESSKMKNNMSDLEQKLKFREQDLLIAHRKSLSLKYDTSLS